MSLTACGNTNTGEVSELQQRVSSLESRVSELEKSESIVNDEVSISEEETTVSAENNATLASGSNTQMPEYLDNQVKSSKPNNWLEVANCDVATEKNLLEVAENCASYFCYSFENSDAVKLATALSNNPNSTDNVMKALTDSNLTDIWLVVANSPRSKEGALQSVAENCASYFCYSFENYDAVKLATALSENPNITKTVMQKLVNSPLPDVVSIGHQWIEGHP